MVARKQYEIAFISMGLWIVLSTLHWNIRLMCITQERTVRETKSENSASKQNI